MEIFIILFVLMVLAFAGCIWGDSCFLKGKIINCRILEKREKDSYTMAHCPPGLNYIPFFIPIKVYELLLQVEGNRYVFQVRKDIFDEVLSGDFIEAEFVRGRFSGKIILKKVHL